MHTTLLPNNVYLHEPRQNGSVLQNVPSCCSGLRRAANANRTLVHVARSHVFGSDKSFSRCSSVGSGGKRPRVDAAPWVTRGMLVLPVLNCAACHR